MIAAALAVAGCATSSRQTLTPAARDASAGEAEIWIGAVQDGDHDRALAAERRLESLVGARETGPWELEAAAARWTEVAVELESDREIYTTQHPTLARALKRYDNVTNAVKQLRSRVSQREYRDVCERTLQELATQQSKQVRELEQLVQIRTDDAPAVVRAKERLRSIDTVIDRLEHLRDS